MPRIGASVDEIGDAPVGGGQGYLEGAHLVDDMAVHADDVGGGGEEVDALGLHCIAGHVVGDDSHLESHVLDDRGGEPGPLEEGTGFGADELNFLADGPALPEHGAYDGFGEALGHDGAPAGELPDQVNRLGGAFRVAPVDHFDVVQKDGIVRGLARRHGGLGHLGAFLGDMGHFFDGRGSGAGEFGGGVVDFFLKIGGVLRLAEDLSGGQGHGHGGGYIGAAGLGHHIPYGLDDLPIIGALQVAELPGVHPSIENTHQSGGFIVPRHIFIFEHESEILVIPFHRRPL